MQSRLNSLIIHRQIESLSSIPNAIRSVFFCSVSSVSAGWLAFIFFISGFVLNIGGIRTSPAFPIYIAITAICIQSTGGHKMSFRWLISFFIIIIIFSTRFPFRFPVDQSQLPKRTTWNEQLNVLLDGWKGADERTREEKDIKLQRSALDNVQRCLSSNLIILMILIENMGTAPCRQLQNERNEKDCSQQRK